MAACAAARTLALADIPCAGDCADCYRFGGSGLVSTYAAAPSGARRACDSDVYRAANFRRKDTRLQGI
jgi:hypothetical protein